MEALVQVNQRVSHAERRGTVRFVGSLEEIINQPGIWAGVEWDQERAGLHDGVLKGKRFFQARPNSASFVLENKLNRGISAREAIQEKYGTPSDADMEIGVRFGQKDVVAVGWEKVVKKVSEFDQLVHVGISGMDVNDTPADLPSLIPNVETLSVGKSLISSWSAVLRLISGLPRLTTLNLTDNRLTIDIDTQADNSDSSDNSDKTSHPDNSNHPDKTSQTNNSSQTNSVSQTDNISRSDNRSQTDNFSHSGSASQADKVSQTVSCNVRRLVLPQNSLVWEDVLKIIAFFPSLEEVFLSENRIKNLFFSKILTNSKIFLIDLDSQTVPLSDWDEILKLGTMSSLRVLQLGGNHFRTITVPDSPVLFHNLTDLSLRLNNITEWRSVSQLNKLPRLENLKLNSNPILDAVERTTGRQWVVARIAGLKILNQSPITSSERRDAERDYMRRHGAEWLAIHAHQPTDLPRKEVFLQEHPRYEKLLERHGPLEADELPSTFSRQLKDNLIKIILQFEERKVEKNLPVTISVLKLKKMAEKLFRIPETDQLWYVTPELPGIRFVLDDDQKEISHYDVKTGDTIVIS